MHWAVFIPLIAALAAPMICRRAGGASGGILTLAPLLSLACILYHLRSGEPVSGGVMWLAGLEVGLWFRLDGLSGTFAVLISGIGALITFYAGGYLKGERYVGRFYLYFLLFMGAMMGLVLADDMICMFVFWELTSVSSFLLIGFKHESREARDAAYKALIVTAGGGLALLAGLVLLALAAVDSGLSWSSAIRFSELPRGGWGSHALYVPAVLLILLGAFTKSAQWPFHFWLPTAMAAPTPVSAYLHSATMVKAGVYLMARLNPVLGDTALWSGLLIAFGAVTMVLAIVMSTGQSDLKLILAYTTLSILGTLTMLIGLGSALAIQAAVVLLVAHALYKAGLFLVAGSVDHATGTRDVRELGGLRGTMPVTAAAAVLAGLSMAGVPPLLGFMAKELMYEAPFGLGSWTPLLIALGVLTNGVMVCMAMVVVLRPFWSAPRPTPREPHEAPPSMLAGPVVLAALGLLIGLWPHAFTDRLGSGMAHAIAGYPIEMHLKLWHGVEPHALLILGLSAATLIFGGVLFAMSRRLMNAIGGLERILRPIGPERIYERAMAELLGLAGLHTRWMQHGYLRYYLILVLMALLALTLEPAVQAMSFDDLRFDLVEVHECVVVGLIVVGCFATAVSREWLAGIVCLGVVGVGVTLIFVLFGAPDLAMTQIMVETLTVFLFVLVFYFLPPGERKGTYMRRGFDAAVAIAVGGIMGMLVLATNGIEFTRSLSEFYASRSLTEAHGRNVVNVILVDFRALDTLGEITVVATAGVGVLALLKLRPMKKPETTKEQETE